MDRIAACFVLVFFYSGCAMHYGGGTLGTGLGESYGASNTRPSDLDGDYLTIAGGIVDAKGMAVSGVSVVVETRGDQSTATSDATGQFQVPLVVVPGSNVVFRFSSSSLNAEYRLADVPMAVRGATLKFRVVSKDSVKLLKIDYEKRE